MFTKEKPLSVRKGLGIEEHDQEGRVVTLEFEKFYFVNVYVPNSKEKLLRLDYRMKWEDDFKKYLLDFLNTFCFYIKFKYLQYLFSFLSYIFRFIYVFKGFRFL